jgi:hypothetical protein
LLREASIHRASEEEFMFRKTATLLLSTALIPALFACRDRRYGEEQRPEPTAAAGDYRGTETTQPAQPAQPAQQAQDTPRPGVPQQGVGTTGQTAAGDEDELRAEREDSGATGDSGRTTETENDRSGSTGASASRETSPASGTTTAKSDISSEDAKSTFNVDIANADAVARFSPQGAGKFRGLAVITDQKLVVAVRDATPGRYTVELSADDSCNTSKVAQNTRPPADKASKDHVVGFVDVGSDGRGHLEANVSGEILGADASNVGGHTILLRSSADEKNVSKATMRAPIACAEINTEQAG